MSEPEQVEQISIRNRIAALMDEAQAAQADAMAGLLEFMEGPDGSAFIQKISDAQQQTIPGSHADQTCGNTLTVLNALKQVAQSIAPLAPLPVIPASPAQ